MNNFILEIWAITKEASSFLLLGFVFAGLIKVFLKEAFIQKHLSQSNFSSVLKAALFGIPLPLCSCGVVPTAISLRKEGASKGATTSFLISTPESGIDSIAISYALLDPLLTIIRPIVAFLSAIFAGLFENNFADETKDTEIDEIKSCCQPKPESTPISCCSTEKNENPESEKLEATCCSTETHEKKESLWTRVLNGQKYAFFDLMNDIAFHLLIGLVLAAAISFFIPDSFFERYLSSPTASIFLMLIIGIPMYICATASTPIAAALILKGLSPGAALVFLMAGPATNLASLLVLQKSLGKATIIRLISSIVVLSLLFAFLTNMLYDALNISASAQINMHQHDKMLSPIIQNIAGILLAFFIVLGIWNDRLKGYFRK